MNIKQIKGFYELTKTLNFSKTANQMYMSQPAFSRMIESLETELGTKLIIRDKVHPSLTPAGQMVRKHVEKILEEYSDMMEEIRNSSDLDGELTIGVLEDGLREDLIRVVRPFMEMNPSVMVNFRPIRESDAFNEVMDNRLDCAILMHFPPVYREMLTADVMGHAIKCAVMNRKNPLAERKTLSVADLKDEHFIIVDESQSRFGFNQTMGTSLQYGFTPNIARRAPSVTMALSEVELNYGVMILHDTMKDLAGKDTVFIPLQGEPEIAMWCVRRPNNANPSMQRFSQYLRSHVRQTAAEDVPEADGQR